MEVHLVLINILVCNEEKPRQFLIFIKEIFHRMNRTNMDSFM